MERPVAVTKNEKMSLIRVFGGRPYKVSIKDKRGMAKAVMDYLFASSPEDARDQAMEAFPGVGADMFIVSEAKEESPSGESSQQYTPACG